MKARIEQWLGTAFGLVFLGLAGVVTVETVMRKLFNVSLQGADELGGYALAVGATLGFSLALLGRSHIRVDVFHEHFPRWLQLALNWLSVVSLAALALLMAWLAWFVIQDTRAYQSVAQTPWATPLVYPQSVWLIGLMVFGAVALFSALRVTWLVLRGHSEQVHRDYGPRSARDEVDEELQDLKARGTSATVESGP